MGRLRVAASIYSGEMQAAMRGPGAARFLKTTLEELLFGNGDIGIEARIRNGNSSVVEHAHSINSVEKDRRPIGCAESNREELETHPWFAVSHIMGPLNISDGMPKTTARRKLILLSRNIPQTASVKVKDEIWKT